MKAASLLKVTVALGATTIAYVKLDRPWVLNWGATKEEAERPMPGDEILPNAALQATRIVTINAPPDYIWPWLVQMGPGPHWQLGPARGPGEASISPRFHPDF